MRLIDDKSVLVRKGSEFLEASEMSHVAGEYQPLVKAVDEIVVVVIKEAYLHAEDDGEAVARHSLGGAVAFEPILRLLVISRTEL